MADNTVTEEGPATDRQPRRQSADTQAADSNPGMYVPEQLVGTTLAHDRYHLRSMAGEGSMAFVYKAWDERLETDVVVKIPKPEKVIDASFRKRFGQEGQLLVRLSHPHITRILDIGEHDGLPFVVMQYLPGGDLLERLHELTAKGGQMSPSSLKGWIREVARALDFVAEQGMVHRDVKPANILFDEHNNAFLSDFGLTKIILGDHRDDQSEMTGAGFVVGTPNYIAPEIVLGAKYDGRADQYSMGLIVYHLMIGEPPMQGPSSAATMVNQTQKRLPLLSEVRGDISEGIALAVNKAIQKKPELRYSSCVEFADAVLAGVAAGASASMIAMRPPVPPSGGSVATRLPPRKRRPKSRPRLSDPSSSTVSQGDSVRDRVSRGQKGLVKCPECRKPLPLRPMHSGRRGRCIFCKARLKVSKDLTKLWLLSSATEDVSASGTRLTTKAKKNGSSKSDELMIGEEVFGWRLSKKNALALAGILLLLLMIASGVLAVHWASKSNDEKVREKTEHLRIVEDGIEGLKGSDEDD